jgi:hypothetical protein
VVGDAPGEDEPQLRERKSLLTAWLTLIRALTSSVDRLLIVAVSSALNVAPEAIKPALVKVSMFDMQTSMGAVKS